MKIWTNENIFETKRNADIAKITSTSITNIRRDEMRTSLLITSLLAFAITATTALAQPGTDDGNLPARKRYLPEYTNSGELILPKNFNE